MLIVSHVVENYSFCFRMSMTVSFYCYRDMFNLSNKKGFEVVMYFLLERLNATTCHEAFRLVNKLLQFDKRMV